MEPNIDKIMKTLIGECCEAYDINMSKFYNVRRKDSLNCMGVKTKVSKARQLFMIVSIRFFYNHQFIKVSNSSMSKYLGITIPTIQHHRKVAFEKYGIDEKFTNLADSILKKVKDL